MSRKKLVALIISLALMAGIALLGLVKLLNVKDTAPRVYGAAPAFQMTDAQGATFDSNQLKDKVWVVDFFFTRCGGPCPTMNKNMQKVGDSLSASGLQLVSITVDPEYDQPEKLATYARKWKADPSTWHFLTASESVILKVSMEGFKMGTEDLINHSTRLALVDKNGLIRGYFDGMEDLEVDKLIQTARTLLKN